MQQKDGAVLTALAQVQSLMDENASLLTAVNATGARKTLDDTIAALRERASDQQVHATESSGARAAQVVARRVLLEQDMRAIASAARGLAAAHPDLAGVKAPSPKARTADLLVAAEGMAKVAATFTDAFSSVLGSDFLTNLQTATTAVLDASAKGIASRGKRTGATADVGALVSRGRNAVKTLDALVKRAFAGNPGLLREWKARRKFVVSTGRQPAATTPPAPAAVTTRGVAQAPPAPHPS